MSKEMKYLKLDIQLFAEGAGGGDGGTGADGGNGVNGGVPSHMAANDLSDVVYGIQDDGNGQSATDETETVDRAKEFEKLIKGEYKDLYDQRMQDTIQRRLKGSKETVDRYNALAPTLEMLSRKYGVDVNDIDALNKAIEEDDAYYEDEALERGLTVDQLKSIRKMERENADLKRQMQEQDVRENADRIYQQWMQDAEALKGVYPSFNLEAELENPRFVDLIKNNVDVRTAYEVLHKDEIIPAAMHFTAQQVQQKMTNKIMSSQRRPSENGMQNRSASLVKSDVSQLSKADRQEINRRVAMGERIRF